MRIIKDIEIEGRNVVALFDTGAMYTCVIREYLLNSVKKKVRVPYRVALGGKMIEVKEKYLIDGSIEEYSFDTEAIPVDEIGKADGHELQAIIGALTMEQWEIKLDPKTGELGLEGLRRREFTEFSRSQSKLSNEEFEVLADQLADEFMDYVGQKRPPLSDYAVSREGIYEDYLLYS